MHVDVPGRDDLKDLLDSVDLNTYGLRRTGLNEKIELDSSETVLDPTKAAMAGAGTSDDAKEELDVILQEFNDKWFKGWDTTPEEQKVKLTAIVNAIKQDNDYLSLIVGNPDKQAAEEALDKIIDRIVRRQRQKDMSLYKEYMSLMKNLWVTKSMRWNILMFCFGLFGLCNNMQKRLPESNVVRNMESF